MGLKTEEVKLGDLPMRITQMPSMESLRMLTRLTKLVGPALAAMGHKAELDSILDAKLTDTELGEAFAVLCDQLAEDEVEAIFMAFAAPTKVQTAKNKWPSLDEMFDVVFAGRMDLMLRWFGASLKVNYDSFLGAAQGSDVLASLRAKAGSKSKPRSRRK